MRFCLPGLVKSLSQFQQTLSTIHIHLMQCISIVKILHQHTYTHKHVYINECIRMSMTF